MSRSFTVVAALVVGLASVAALAAPAYAQPQVYTVPPGVSVIRVDVAGAGGGAGGPDAACGGVGGAGGRTVAI
ncbi:MAG: hypothetical protein K8M05_40275, partial [Deltaproteobacteria bacterium]|nr:hypothetical protein [Kofleriaceae bacterium]